MGQVIWLRVFSHNHQIDRVLVPLLCCTTSDACRAHRWEDGQLVVDEVLETTDRWVMHTATEIKVSIAGVSISIKQQPGELNATRVGVGACLWEGELLLAAYLGA